MSIIALPSATISPALSASEYATIVAALRMLEDDMRDCDLPEALKVADEAVALRAKLRSYADRRGRAADIIALPVVTR